METLTTYIQNCYDLARKYPDTAMTKCDQAFGALCYHYTANPRDFDDCEKLWNEMRPKFYEIMMRGL
jgi:uncharacterized protein VirK/YbjX